MTFYLGELADRIMRGKLAGKGFAEIAEICNIPDASFVSFIYTWKMYQEPIIWKQQLLDLELSRIDALQDAYWADAVSGDSKAARVVLDACKARKAIIEQFADLPDGTLEDVSQMFIENKKDSMAVEKILEDQLKRLNKVMKN